MQKNYTNLTLLQSQKKYNKDILYLACPRDFFKQIMMCIYRKENFDFNDFKHSYENNKLNISNKKKYKDFLLTFLQVLKKKYNFNILISFSFLYSAERELHEACCQLKIPFLILEKSLVADIVNLIIIGMSLFLYGLVTFCF